MKMTKKQIWIVSAALVITLAIAAAVPAVKIHKNTKAAAQAAEEFTALLKEGKLTELRISRYLPDTANMQAINSGDGKTLAVYADKAALAQRYGADAVLDGTEESEDDRLLAMLMDYSEISMKTKTVLGSSSSAKMTASVPDFQSWAAELTIGELQEIAAGYENGMDALKDCLNRGEIPKTQLTFSIPMRKVNGEWKFGVTKEMENIFFGGLMGTESE